jgi:hypothetical protein
MLVTLYRGTDKKPPLLELSDIEAISALSSPNNEKAGEWARLSLHNEMYEAMMSTSPKFQKMRVHLP